MEDDTTDSLADAIVKINKYAQERSNTMAISPNRIINPAMGTWAPPTSGTLTVNGNPVDLKPFELYPDMDMLNDASSPYNIDLETLSNLWVVRFGKEWVSLEVVEEARDGDDNVEFWKHTANRLRELGYLEMHTLASSYRIVLRIVE